MANHDAMAPRRFLSLVEDYLAGLGAAKRSEHTISAYRADLAATRRSGPRSSRIAVRESVADGVADRIAARLQGLARLL